MNIEQVISYYFPDAKMVSSKQYTDGRVNITYHVVVEQDGKSKDYIVQKMHGLFDTSLMLDMDAIMKHLLSKNILAPEVIQTPDNKLFLEDEESWWRIITYIQGTGLSENISPDQAREAGRLVGEVHTALLDCNHEFKHTIPHFHDTPFTMKALESTLDENKDSKKYSQLKNLAQNILDAYKQLPKENDLPKRIIHGDLKMDNVRFDEKEKKAIALIDFDTCMRDTIAAEMGDALRSWCMPGGEDVNEVTFDKKLYTTALEGYVSSATFLDQEEKKSIPFGVMRITLDLAARFTADAFNESYFELDTSKYKNFFEQNKKKAENQFAFFERFKEGLNLDKA